MTERIRHLADDEFGYRFTMAAIDGGFPTPRAQNEMRDWCLGNMPTGAFRLRWRKNTGRLRVLVADERSAFAFKLRYQEDIAHEERPEKNDAA
jgi:hypothetical protein